MTPPKGHVLRCALWVYIVEQCKLFRCGRLRQNSDRNGVKESMDGDKEKLVISGNAFYEIDLDCLRKKEQEKREKETKRCEQQAYKKKRG